MKHTIAWSMRGASVALGGLIVLVTAAVPSVQAQVCEFSRDDDPPDLPPNTFRSCVEEANVGPAINTVRGAFLSPSKVTLQLGRTAITSSMTIDGRDLLTLFNQFTTALALSGGNTLTIATPITIQTEAGAGYGIEATGGAKNLSGKLLNPLNHL